MDMATEQDWQTERFGKVELEESTRFRTSPLRDHCAALAHKLYAFCVVPVTGFEKKAIFALVKRLRARPQMIDELCAALDSKGDVDSGCVTFPRTRDGRMQIGKEKHTPSHVYCRLFRFGDVTRGELVPVSSCAHRGGNGDMFCVNPYHYERSFVTPHRRRYTLPSEKEERRSDTPGSAVDLASEQAILVKEEKPKQLFPLAATQPRIHAESYPKKFQSTPCYYDPAKLIGTIFLDPYFDMAPGADIPKPPRLEFDNPFEAPEA